MIRSLITLITPDILMESQKRRTCEDGSYREAVEEHEAVLQAIKARDPEGAARAMEKHMAVWRRICGEKLLRASPSAERHGSGVSVVD